MPTKPSPQLEPCVPHHVYLSNRGRLICSRCEAEFVQPTQTSEPARAQSAEQFFIDNWIKITGMPLSPAQCEAAVKFAEAYAAPLKEENAQIWEALRKCGEVLQSLDLETDFYINGKRHAYVKQTLVNCLTEINEIFRPADERARDLLGE